MVEKPVKAVSRVINTDLRQSCRVEVMVYSGTVLLALIHFIDREPRQSSRLRVRLRWLQSLTKLGCRDIIKDHCFKLVEKHYF